MFFETIAPTRSRIYCSQKMRAHARKAIYARFRIRIFLNMSKVGTICSKSDCDERRYFELHLLSATTFLERAGLLQRLLKRQLDLPFSCRRREMTLLRSPI